MTKDDRLKRLALQIAAELPADLGKAMRKFELVKELIEEAYCARIPVKARTELS